jgi:hypothetical protein
MDAEDWLTDTERKMKAVGANDEEKVCYATHLLSGPAASWWDNEVTLQLLEKVLTVACCVVNDQPVGNPKRKV